MNRRILQTIGALLLSIGFNNAILSQGLAGKSLRNSDIENIGKREINKGQTNFSSLSSEVGIGREAAVRVERDASLVDDSEINGYVDRIAQNIAKHSDSKFPITIKVIQSDDVNAFALPGGFIYLNSGAIRAVDSEAELAFVIAQLIGHVAARHATSGNSRGNLFQISSIPSIVLTGGVAGTALQQTPIGLPIGMLRFSQEAVLEADFLGLEYLYEDGYDPHAAIGFLRKIETAEASRPIQSPRFNMHPPAAERVESMDRTMKNVLPARAINVVNTPELDAVKVRVSR